MTKNWSRVTLDNFDIGPKTKWINLKRCLFQQQLQSYSRIPYVLCWFSANLNFRAEFDESGEVFIIKSTTHKVSKKLFFIKIYSRKPEISSIECQKTCKINWKRWHLMKQYEFRSISDAFWHSIENISGFRG
jgi:hypothetical protein